MLPAAGLVLALLPIATTQVQIAGILIAYGLVGKLAVDPLLLAYLAEASEPRSYSTTFAVFNFAGMAPSVVAPLVAGILSEVTGTMDSAFYVSAGLLVIGALVLAVYGEEPRPSAPS